MLDSLDRRYCSPIVRLLVPLVLAVVLAGCGGGGGGDGEDDQTQFSIASSGDLDGTVLGDNVDVQSSTDESPGVGDNPFIPMVTNGAARFVAYYSFDISAIPAGSTIKMATLSLFNRVTVGDPKGMMVLVRIDHVDYGNVFPTTLLGATGLDLNFATIDDIDVTGRKNVDVMTQLQADLDAGRATSQYRLRGAIASNFDSLADVAVLTDGEDSQDTGELPLLNVEIE